MNIDFFFKRWKNWFFIFEIKKIGYLCNPYQNGVVAQLVEQRTENPCVTGSIPVDTTCKIKGFGTKVSDPFVFKGFRALRIKFWNIFSKVCSIFSHKNRTIILTWKEMRMNKAKCKIILRKDFSRKNLTNSLVLRIRLNGKTKFFSLGHSVAENF